MFAKILHHLPIRKNIWLRQFDWMEFSGIVVIIVDGIFSFSFAEPDHILRRWWVIPILTLFMIAHLWSKIEDASPHLQHLRIGFMTLLACTMFWATHETFSAYLLFFILSATVALIFPTPTAYKWIALYGVISIIAPMFIWSVFWPAVLIGASTLGGYLFFAAAANAQRRAEEASAESRRLLGELQSAYRQLEEQASQAEELAASEERNRLAREVHDTLGHRLTVAAVQLEGAQRLVHQAPDKAASMVGTVREQVLEGLSELRRTVATLRAPLEEDLSLPNALTRLTTNFQDATGIHTMLELDADLPPLPDQKRHAVYRAAQESLTNIQRHAQADHAWVQLEQSNGYIVLAVSDDGIGMNREKKSTGFGLRGLYERADQLGGTFDIVERLAGGTHISFTVPVDEHEGTMRGIAA